MLLAIVVALAVTAFCLRDYISLFLLSRENTDLLKQKAADTMSSEKLLENYRDINVRDLTADEQEKLANNELSEEEAVELILGMLNPPPDDAPETPDPTTTDVPDDTTPDVNTATPPASDPPATPANPQPPAQTQTNPAADPQPQTPSEPQPDPQSDAKIKEANEKIARLVAQLYVAKAQSHTSIENLVDELKAEYLALPSSERKGALKGLASKALSAVSSMEKEYDAKVDDILSQMETLLKDSGQDLSLIDSIRKAYEDEKTYTKAYYLNKASKLL